MHARAHVNQRARPGSANQSTTHKQPTTPTVTTTSSTTTTTGCTCMCTRSSPSCTFVTHRPHAAGLERPPGPIHNDNWRFIATPYVSHEHINVYSNEGDTAGAGICIGYFCIALLARMHSARVRVAFACIHACMHPCMQASAAPSLAGAPCSPCRLCPSPNTTSGGPARRGG